MLKKFLAQASRVNFYIYLFLVFFPVRDLIFTPTIFVNGFFDSYASQFFSLGYLFLIVSFFFYLIMKLIDSDVRQFTLFDYFLFLFFFLIFFFSFFAGDMRAALWFSFDFLMLIFAYLVLSSGLIDFKFFAKVFLIFLSFAFLIAFYQLVFQQSLGLHFIGEPLLSSDLKGVARYPYVFSHLFKPYAAFAHPNVFGAFIFVACFLLMLLKPLHAKIWNYLSLIICVLMSILVFSRLALVVIFVFFLVYFLFAFFENRHWWSQLSKYGVIIFYFALIVGLNSLMILDVSTSSVERLNLLDIAWKMFWDNSLLGVGGGNFTLEMSHYFSFELAPWLYQPVHNVFFLVAAEFGVLVLALFFGLFFWMLKEAVDSGTVRQKFLVTLLICSFVVLAFFDHYLLTLDQGRFLLVLLFAVFSLSSRGEMTDIR